LAAFRAAVVPLRFAFVFTALAEPAAHAAPAQFNDPGVVFGVNVNDDPATSDPWNRLPVWSADLAPAPAAAPLLNGVLAPTSLGASASAWIADSLYLQAGGYASPKANPMGWPRADLVGPGQIKGLAPYGRIAYQRDLAGGLAHLGAFALAARIRPWADSTTGLVDHYTDTGLDGSYQRMLPNGDVVSFDARWLRESQRLDATCALVGGDATCPRNSLEDVRADVSYAWRNRISGMLQVFESSGGANPFVYAANRTFKPDNAGIMLRLEAMPFAGAPGPARRFDLRTGVQYVHYTRFNDAGANFESLGPLTSDKDALRVFVWFAF
jgi:hypothetical protein